ncbi:hypothetical protein ACS0TY_002610 [Phlomoides rotata]
MTFNVSGMGKRMKRYEVRRIIKENGVDMCCLQETKLEYLEDRIGFDLWPGKDFDWAWREVEGCSGGLISIWNRKIFVKTSSWHDKGILVVNGRWIDDNEEMVILNVYAPCDHTEKALLWEMINLIIEQNVEAKVCVAGDFNSIREEGERCGKGVVIDRRDIKLFDDFILTSGLIDLQLWGRKYTWYKSGMLQKQIGPDYGWKSFSLKKKLKLLKKDLKVWSRETFGAIQHKIDDQREIIECLDRFDEVFGLEEEEIIERNKIGAELKRNMIWNDKFIFQKAKSKWLKEGDVNSKFFHRWINKRIKINIIEGLFVNEEWIESKDGIRNAIFSHFRSHFRSFRSLKCFLRTWLSNFDKSSLWGINIDHGVMDNLGIEIGCEVGKTPFSYLGLNVGFNHRKISAWDNLVEKVKKKLEKWSGKHISFAGRITLVQAIWRLSNEPNRLWVKVLNSKYGGLVCMHEFARKVANGEECNIPTNWSGWWRDLVSLCSNGEDSDSRLMLRKRVGNGSGTDFWGEWWVGEKPLKCSFNRLYRISLQKSFSIEQMGSWREGLWVWEFRWARSLNSREVESVETLTWVLNSYSLNQHVHDFWSWNGDLDGKFKVKRAYNVLAAASENNAEPEVLEAFACYGKVR